MSVSIVKSLKKSGGLDFNRRRRKIDWGRVRYVLVLAIQLCIAISLGYLVVMAFGRQVEVSNDSMAPTYEKGDVLLVSTVSYRIGEPKRGDVIAFKPGSNVNASYSIKRIIAVPGDSIYISGGRIYLNGELYRESGSVESIENPGIAASELTLSEDEYFVLGDNRNSSEDSRYESVGMVSVSDMLGEVWLKYPF